MQVVTLSNFSAVLQDIETQQAISLDTETTGLKVYKEDRLFSIIIATAAEEYYFNFNQTPDCKGNVAEVILPRELIVDIIISVLRVKKIFKANAKFDMGMLLKEIPAPTQLAWPIIHDVLVMDRLIFNDHISYSLESVAKRNGYEKDSTVEDYIDENKLWKWEVVPHRKKRDKLKFYNLVPFDLIYKYGCKDARITFDIGVKQEAKLSAGNIQIRATKYTPYEIETNATIALFRMEQEGILIDENYAKEKALEHQVATEQTSRRFHDETKQVFIDSAAALSPLFKQAGFTPPKTDKDNDSIPDDWLESIVHPLGDMVRAIRTNAKSTGFYKSYLYYADSKKVLHANTNQSGTRTGRFSMSNPNLQQVPDSEVRRAFVAPENYVLASLDFDQQEYKMMLDYAGQEDLIHEVKVNKLDVHEATAKIMGVERKPAKTLNFMLLYGGGVVKLAIALFKVTATEPILWVIWKQANGWKLDADDIKWLPAVTEELIAENLPELYKAEALREKYFEKLPKVQDLIEACKNTAADRGFIHTWTGRKIFFRKNFSYKAPNALIQGGASDVCKVAIIDIDKLLLKRRSKLLLSIHDELVLKIHKDEMPIISEVKHIMESAFPHTRLPLTVAANVGNNLWEMEKYEG